jgi:hypothetical protein
MLATEYAKYYDLPPQGEKETDLEFRGRVSNFLRDKCLIIEAHEAYQDERWENSEDVMTGLFGAIGQALQGTNYSGNKVGNDIAAGTIVRHQMSPEGQREKEANEMLRGFLLAGLSPDDIGSLLK